METNFSKVKAWTLDNRPCKLFKVFVKDLGLVEVCPSL